MRKQYNFSSVKVTFLIYNQEYNLVDRDIRVCQLVSNGF